MVHFFVCLMWLIECIKAFKIKIIWTKYSLEKFEPFWLIISYNKKYVKTISRKRRIFFGRNLNLTVNRKWNFSCQIILRSWQQCELWILEQCIHFIITVAYKLIEFRNESSDDKMILFISIFVAFLGRFYSKAMDTFKIFLH